MTIELNPGEGGEQLATDEISLLHYQMVKAGFGETGSFTQVSSTDPMPVCVSANGDQNQLFMRHADVNGDGTGDISGVGDFSITPRVLKVTPPAGTVYRIARLIAYIEDTAGGDADNYGNLGYALTNGIILQCMEDGVAVCELTNSAPVKTNAEWAGTCYDASLMTWSGGSESFVVRWSFDKAGQFLRLDGDQIQELQVVLNDDLSGLISHRFFFQGYIESYPS